LIVLSISCSSGTNEKAGTPVSLHGNWKIVESDVAEGSQYLYNDSLCREITIPGDWPNLLAKDKNRETTVWLRKKVHIGADLKGMSLHLFLGNIGVADETYFNGVLIGSTGSIPSESQPLAYHFALQMPRIYFIPESLLKFGSENVIAVRIYSHVISGIHGNIHIAGSSNRYQPGAFKPYLPIIANMSAVSLNIMFFLLILAIFISNPRKIEYLYFSMILLFTVLCALLIIDYAIIIDGLLRYKIFLVLYCLVNCFVLLAIERFFEARMLPVRIAAPASLFAVAVCIICAPDTASLLGLRGGIAIGYINVCIIVAAVITLFAIKRDPRKYWYFIFIGVLIPVSVFRNSYFLFTEQFHEFPSVIFFHIPVVFFVIIVYQIYDLQKQKQEKETLYSALSRKTLKYEKLLDSIRKKDAKPEPRDKIHEVIEYLNTNYSEKYNRHNLACRFNMNEDYIGQVFKKTTGMNISGYINKVRIDVAIELLNETDTKIIDIAYHIGFENLTHFHRLFKNQTGLTPNQYRQKKCLKN